MKTLYRLIQGGVLAGFLLSSGGCLIAPERDHGGERGQEGGHERDGDRGNHDREHRCDERDDRCRDR
ncbi:MAG: hypothetical protein M3N97_10830 [Pseudomonadota bacterium]|nr:hypothetical protein [Pseudomonadota bacterium]